MTDTDSFPLSGIWLHPTCKVAGSGVRYRRGIPAGSRSIRGKHRRQRTIKVITAQESALLTETPKRAERAERALKHLLLSYKTAGQCPDQRQLLLLSVTQAAGNPRPSSGLYMSLHIHMYTCIHSDRMHEHTHFKRTQSGLGI